MEISVLDDTEEMRVTLRRATYDFRQVLRAHAIKVETINGDAERAIHRADIALFEAWTYLCANSPDGEDDDHD